MQRRRPHSRAAGAGDGGYGFDAGIGGRRRKGGAVDGLLHSIPLACYFVLFSVLCVLAVIITINFTAALKARMQPIDVLPASATHTHPSKVDETHVERYVRAARRAHEFASTIAQGAYNPKSYSWSMNYAGGLEAVLYAVRNAQLAASLVAAAGIYEQLQAVEHEIHQAFAEQHRNRDDHTPIQAALVKLLQRSQSLVEATAAAVATQAKDFRRQREAGRVDEHSFSALDDQRFEHRRRLRAATLAAAPLGANYSADRQFVTLRNGVTIPTLAFGTWQLDHDTTRSAVLTALLKGYRRIDTAQVYGNEIEVGMAMSASGVPRDQIVVTTKIATSDLGAAPTRARFQQQLTAMRLTYIDVYMVHGARGSSEDDLRALAETWQVLEELYERKQIRVLAVSNFDQWWLSKLFESARIKPHVVQNHYSLYHHGHQMLLSKHEETIDAFCARHGILIEAYSPLSAWPWALRGRDDVHVEAIAADVQRSPTQVVLRWLLQRGLAVLVRSSVGDHIVENAQLFDFALSTEDMAMLDALHWMVASPLYEPEGDGADNVFGIVGT